MNNERRTKRAFSGRLRRDGCTAAGAPPAAAAACDGSSQHHVLARAEHRKLSERTTLCVQCMACSR
jgi:hypothetical protein